MIESAAWYCYNTWTSTLWIPDMSDRHAYFYFLLIVLWLTHMDLPIPLPFALLSSLPFTQLLYAFHPLPSCYIHYALCPSSLCIWTNVLVKLNPKFDLVCSCNSTIINCTQLQFESSLPHSSQTWVLVLRLSADLSSIWLNTSLCLVHLATVQPST